ncbi:hypothetical protein D9M68_640520 [compost metagenome]
MNSLRCFSYSFIWASVSCLYDIEFNDWASASLRPLILTLSPLAIFRLSALKRIASFLNSSYFAFSFAISSSLADKSSVLLFLISSCILSCREFLFLRSWSIPSPDDATDWPKAIFNSFLNSLSFFTFSAYSLVVVSMDFIESCKSLISFLITSVVLLVSVSISEFPSPPNISFFVIGFLLAVSK